MTSASNFPTLNQTAFVTAVTLSVVTGGSVFMAATTASTVATVAYTVLAITSGALSMASITAWFASEDLAKPAQYFETFKGHAGFAIVGTFQYATQVMLQALIRGLAEGVSAAVFKKVAG